LLMDDHSNDLDVLAYYKELKSKYSNINVHDNQGEFNYSRVNNEGARLAKGDLLLFLNNDVEFISDVWLHEMVRWALLPNVGIVGAKLFYPDGSIQHAGIVLGMTGHAGHVFAGSAQIQSDIFISPDCYRNVSAVTGACMLVRREVFERIGGFDENLALVFNDVEICLRARGNGFRTVFTPAAQIIHYEGRSRSRYIPGHDISLGANLLWKDIEVGDPYYNPNLSLSVNWPTFRRINEVSALHRLKKIVQYKGRTV
jgi:O-antigen biosynthesis protein